MAAVIRRLGILGGTFDPIHHGHLVAAQEAWYQLALDRVLFVPAGSPPHKPGQRIAAALHRQRMVKLAIEGRPQFSLSQADLDRPGASYTVDMLRLLKAEWGPEVTLYFIEGSDSLADIVKWYRPEQILELAQLAVVSRRGATVDLAGLEDKLPGITSRVHWVQMPWLEISASDLRARIREGRPITYLVPPAVERYISEHHLYRE